MIPRATYRLQFRKEFPFEAAREIVPYLARLGISHVYASPILAAREGSPHGYDVIDHSRVNPELGGEQGLVGLVSYLKHHGMGLIVDIVPNHMAAGAGNRWWMDVLEHGLGSEYAGYFDIDWDPPERALRNRLLLPILGAPLRETLARNEIALRRDEASGKPVIVYGGHRLPVRPEDACRISVAPATSDESRDELAHLLDRQHYRLAWWRIAGDAINWRRFFDINDLVALRIEQASVFEEVHRKHFALFAQRLIDGFRIDHVDGLADPAAYCRKLRARLDVLKENGRGRVYLVTEKILSGGEELPRDWELDGTTGYDFMNDVAAVLHDPQGADPLGRLWTEFSGRTADFEREEREARRRILTGKFYGAFEAAARAFHALDGEQSRDTTLASFERTLARLMTELRTYRLYATGGADSPPPGPFFDRAVERALDRAPANDVAALRQIVEAMNGRARGPEDLRRLAVRSFNQLAAALAAKAGEDTAYYRYGRLLSRDEVGSNPAHFSLSPAAFHRRARARLSGAPLLATATHDHKRGEDARARLAVLSEICEEWGLVAQSWFRLNSTLRDALLDPGDEYQLYQSLVATWPLELSTADGDGLARFAERMLAWRLKSLHEAKIHTSWSDPDPAYEKASADFLRALLDPEISADFLCALSGFVTRIAPAAALNGLAQSALRCTVPGVPDLYQGAEYWDLSLVDPDNRRAIDFNSRAATLKGEPVDLLAHWQDGRVKQNMLARLLGFRQRHEKCFRFGDYRPLEARGRRSEQVLGFARLRESAAMLVAVPRLCAGACIEARSPHPSAQFWSDTVVSLPSGLKNRRWSSVLSSERFSAEAGALACVQIFARFPVAVLVAEE